LNIPAPPRASVLLGIAVALADLEAEGAAVPVRDEVRSHLATNLDAYFLGEDRTEVKESNLGIRRIHRFVLKVSIGAGRGVEEGEPAGAATVMANTQEHGAAARRHELARRVADLDLRTADSK
jgi:hypothetical protein